MRTATGPRCCRSGSGIWDHTLRSLATSLGIDGAPTKDIVCVDRKRQWKQFGNVRHDPVLRAVAHPFSGRRGTKKV